MTDYKKIYFVGIGGIGMSAIARYFNGLGVDIYGYDKTETVLTKKLVEEGMQIHYEDDPTQIPDNIDLVVYTPAVPNTHKELNFFWDNGFEVKKRAEVLGIISRNRRCIAIAGTHGKTSTSSILTHLLKVGGVDCTAFLGGIAQNYESNFVQGHSDWVVVEADEYDRSFLHLSPDIEAIMSIDADHLDIYDDEQKMFETGFGEFVKKIKPNGKIFLQKDVETHFEGLNNESFGIETGTYRATNIKVANGFFVFDIQSPIENIENIRFTLPGNHNVENATASIAIAQQLGVTGEAVKQAMASFKGIKRRFEFIHKDDKHVYIDDYAHHPSELQAAIGATKMLYPDRHLTGIFQPHLYSRTRDFVDGFADALDQLDEILLMDIYPARELPIEGVSSKIIFDKMKNNNKQLVTKANVMQVLKTKNVDVLMTLGAGDIDTFVSKIKNWLDY